ncbi:AAA family ATPase [Azotobacter vinelandii]|uniref:AAA family ATPase n=1 Tax=Azotobacter vinelandii TaxID=354 RepID=UPI0007742C9B|nr:AAA family ATPase [Azotobacter vinelandii]
MTSLHADDALLIHYQLNHDPFAPRTPGFKFFPAQRKQVLGQLHHLARYSRLLLVVSGPSGSGKTLLRQALVASSNKQTVQCVVVSARASARVDGLLRQIALGLGLDRADERAILDQVERLASAGQGLYLLVDDAELLETAALDALLALAAGTDIGRPHVFLFGEPELVARLQALADGEERFHVLRLNPYTLDDTREYLAQRLEGAGGDIGLFSDEQIEAIHRGAGGWPGEINRLARELLHEEMLAGHEEEDERAPGAMLPKKHLLALAGVVLVVAVAWFMRGGTGDEEPVAQQPQAEAPAAPPEPTGAAPAPSVAGGAQPVLREPLAQAAGEADAEDIGIAGPAAVVAATASSALAPTVQAPVVPSVPAPKPEVRAPAAVQPTTPKPKPASQTPAPAPAVAKPAAPPAPAPAPRVVAKPAASAPAPSAPAAPVAAKPAPAAPVSRPAAAASSAAPAGSDWYRSQAATRYALQVLGTRSEGSAQAFVRAQGAGYRYFRKLHQGKPLFVVTYGSFASRAEAQAAVRTLPASVQASKPWPRTFASIQQEAGVR